MKTFFLSSSMLLFAFFTQGQKLHLNIYTGFSNYQGELQDKRLALNQAHLAGGLGFSYDIANHFSIRTGVTISKLSGDDKDGRNKARNLNFSTGLTEANVGLEYFITAPVEAHSLTPYLFAGVALYHFNPYTHDTTGTKYFLQPLSTEGEGFVAGRSDYKLTQFAIPFGAGVKLSLTDNVNVGLEFGYRKLFTDYLDDVSTTYVDKAQLLANRGAKAVELSYRGDELKNGSLVYPHSGQQRGSSKAKDAYYFTMLTISFRLGSGGLGAMEYRCPGNVL